ncbi:MAG: MucB/RseB C-terminal domain-containing protein [Gammaproteobacteria bacterium]|nr:MucB/RseB C-terminal domain-containing protein [Gammaproteobacteria bacterium]
MTRNKRVRHAWLSLLVLMSPVVVWAGDAGTAGTGAGDARELLRQMSVASMGLNYRGTFVYLHNGQLEAMQVIHRAAKDGEQERLVALTGEAREVIRDKDKVTCILPNSKAVMVDKSIPRQAFPAALPHDLNALTDTYEFQVLGEDRMSGRPARIVAIRPLDAFRYGYRLWLERDRHLLLKSELIDGDGRAVEQTMFTALEILDAVADAELQPALQGEGYTRHGYAPKASAEAAVPVDGGAGDSAWSVAGLPAGFMRTHYNRHGLPSDRGPVEHMVFSDGLATVSVYIEPHRSDVEGLSGVSSRGAVNALGTRVGDYQITVVGEVPRVTVERIGESVQRRP